MEELNIMDENEFIKEGSKIGVCFICKWTIRKNNVWNNQATINLHGRKICGGCLRSLSKPVARAETLYAKEKKDKDKKLKQIENTGAWVNPDTGRIERA